MQAYFTLPFLFHFQHITGICPTCTMQQKHCWLAVLLAFAFSASAQNQNFQLRSSLTFPGQTLANVCGWTAPDGKEYALVGASQGLVIVDISNPDEPQQIVQIPGPDNLWKEIKTYSHYAYVTSEGGGGVQIVDLSALPSANLQYHNYRGTGAIANQMDAIHALHIDQEKGILYTYGGNFSHGVAHDLNADPYNPQYVGEFSALGYIHDGYASNDTLYACHIYTGLMSIVDMTDKTNPVLLGSVETPGKFTHNSWLLSDHKHIFTTDEATPSFVTSYDISDPSDPKELDRFTIDNGNNSIGHNVHVINDWLVTSWYTGGVVITDGHRPDNLVQTGRYDTWPGGGAGFDGCWGAFPFFPSGTVIASNIEPAELFILTPTYKRACYLEGVVKNGCNGQPLAGAQIEISGNTQATTLSNNFGVAKTGQVTPGSFTVTISRAGYATQTFQATLATAEVTTFDITLEPLASYSLSGTIQDVVAGTPLSGIPVVISNATQTYELQSDASGAFDVSCVPGGVYTVNAGEWGYYAASQTVTLNGNSTVNLQLQPGYYDNFNLDYGWSSEGTSVSGLWEQGEPVGTQLQGSLANPEEDVDTDAGDQCYVTGNGGGQAGTDDVDDGEVTLTSPPMLLANYTNGAVLTFSYWFFNGGGNGTPNDFLEVRATNGTQDVVIFTENTPASEWRESGEIHLEDYLTLNDNVRVSFTAVDESPGHVVEAAVDVFKVEAGTVGTSQPSLTAQLSVSPNPSNSDFALRFSLPATATGAVLEIRNTLGQLVEQQALTSTTGQVRFGAAAPAGVYFATVRSGAASSAAVRVVKQ
jgi:choice-of-anchor B domain-containing protein